MSGESVKVLLDDEDWTVRLAAVLNAPLSCLEAMTEDADPEVREAIQERLLAESTSNTD